MTRRSERGFTLLEMILVVGVLVGFLAAVGTVLLNATRAVVRTRACADGVSGLGRALRSLEPDLRSADRVETLPTGEVRLRSGMETVSYGIEKGVLLRRSSEGTDRIASGISALRVTEEEGLRRVTLDLATRAGQGRARAGVTTLVAPRVGEGVR